MQTKIKNFLVNKKKRVYSIRLEFFLLLFYTVFILINDFFCFLFKTNQTWYFYLISFCITFLGTILVLRKTNIEKPPVSRYDLVFVAMIALIFFIRIFIPDSSFDTLNYHIIAQEQVFSDNVGFNFFPGRWINTHSLSLADRMHYFFRLILGYRLGIVLNFILLVIIYYQIKRILILVLRGKKESTIAMVAALGIITEQILTNSMTYYVDLFSIPFFLEMIMLILDKKGKPKHFTVALACGILVSLKLSNGFLMVLFLVVYLLRFYKTLKLKTVIICGVIMVLPLGVNLTNNYIQTKNPIFPFYNSLFKSPFYEKSNFYEDCYGPKGKKETLVWPIIALFDTRRAFDTKTYYGRISFGYIAALVMLLVIIYTKIRHKEQDKLKIFLIIFYILACLIWSKFMLGYIRYALILEVLAWFSIVICLEWCFKDKNRLGYILGAVLAGATFYQISCSIGDVMVGVRESSWRRPLTLDDENYWKNFEVKSYDYKEKVRNYGIDCFGIVDYNSGYASLLGLDVPIIQLNEGFANKYGKNKQLELLKKCKNIYTVSTTVTRERTEKYLEKTGYKINGKVKKMKVDFVDINNSLILFPITKAKK